MVNEGLCFVFQTYANYLRNTTEKTLTHDLLIRPVQKDDFNQWKPLWNGYNAFYGRRMRTALPDAITSSTWSRFFDSDAEPVHALVLNKPDQILGLCPLPLHRSTISIAPTCYLQDLSQSRPHAPKASAARSPGSLRRAEDAAAAGSTGRHTKRMPPRCS